MIRKRREAGRVGRERIVLERKDRTGGRKGGERKERTEGLQGVSGFGGQRGYGERERALEGENRDETKERQATERWRGIGGQAGEGEGEDKSV